MKSNVGLTAEYPLGFEDRGITQLTLFLINDLLMSAVAPECL